MRLALTFLFAALTASAQWRAFVDLEGATDGVAIDTNTLASGAHGMPLTFGISGPGMTNDATGQNALLGYVDVKKYGVWNGAGNNGVRGNLSEKGNYATASFGSNGLSGSAGCWIKTDLVGTNQPGINLDVFTLMTQTAGDFVNCDLETSNDGTRLMVALENTGTNGIPHVDFTPTNWIWMACGYNIHGSNCIALYTINGDLIGESDVQFGGTNYPSSVRFGNSNSNVGTSYPTNHIWEDSILIDISDNPEWPLLPGVRGWSAISVTNINAGTITISKP